MSHVANAAAAAGGGSAQLLTSVLAASAVEKETTTKEVKTAGASPHRTTASAWGRINSNLWLSAFIRLLILLTICAFIYIILQYAILPAVLKSLKGADDAQARERTIATAIVNLTNAIVIIVAVMGGLSIVGVGASAILTVTGIISLIIGLAAQSVLKDVMNGLLLLFENQLNIGDEVAINALGVGPPYQGKVHEFGIRATTLRAPNGSLIYIPNGTIISVTNYDHFMHTSFISVSLAYLGNVDTVLQSFRNMCMAMQRNEEFMTLVFTGPEVIGITSLTPGYYVLELSISSPSRSASKVTRALRKEIVRLMELINVKGTISFAAVQQVGTTNSSPQTNAQRNTDSTRTTQTPASRASRFLTSASSAIGIPQPQAGQAPPAAYSVPYTQNADAAAQTDHALQFAGEAAGLPIVL